MKNRAFIIYGILIIVVVIAGCAKSPVMQDGKQVTIFIVSDRGIKDTMEQNERDDRNEVGEFMEVDLLKKLKNEGYIATVIRDRGQYVQGTAHYLLNVRIDMLRLVGKASRFWLGHATGPTILNIHYEAVGPNNRQFAYDDNDTTIRDWMLAPKALNERLVNRVNDSIIAKSK